MRRTITTLTLAWAMLAAVTVPIAPAYAADGPATAAATVLTWPYVKKGASGHPVKTLQRLLNFRGASPTLVIDGEFGPLTDREVRDFQRSHALAVDGIVGPNTWKKLITLLVQGSTGGAVRAFGEEKCFRQLKGGGCTIDSTYGSDDVAWVKAFQECAVITIDGKTGPQTWEQLVAGACSF
jgi:peptidoglycan hydrolase-like protein with peptidoglycan-binding domain